MLASPEIISHTVIHYDSLLKTANLKLYKTSCSSRNSNAVSAWHRRLNYSVGTYVYANIFGYVTVKMVYLFNGATTWVPPTTNNSAPPSRPLPTSFGAVVA